MQTLSCTRIFVCLVGISFIFLFVSVACTSLEEERKIMFCLKSCLCRKHAVFYILHYFLYFLCSIGFFHLLNLIGMWKKLCFWPGTHLVLLLFLFEFYILLILKGLSFLLAVKCSGLKEWTGLLRHLKGLEFNLFSCFSLTMLFSVSLGNKIECCQYWSFPWHIWFV